MGRLRALMTPRAERWALPAGLLLLSVLGCGHCKSPSQPAKVAPPLSAVEVEAVCVDCDERFGTKSHDEILAGLVGNKYTQSLRNALYFQDTVHQFESKVHFDNCDFAGAKTYLDSRLALVGVHVDAASKSHSLTDREGELRKAFFALGQALHVVQDFYAHTNYVELVAPRHKRLADLSVLPAWTEEGAKALIDLQREGLVSGRVAWGFPKLCAATVPTHGEMAKDSATTNAGKIGVANLEGMSQYEIAKHLAREASIDLIRFVFDRHSALRKANGSDVAFEVISDNRMHR